MFLISYYQISRKSIFIRFSSVFIVVIALAIALYAVNYLMGSPSEIGKFMPIRKFSFLTLKGALAHSLLWKTAFTIHLMAEPCC